MEDTMYANRYQPDSDLILHQYNKMTAGTSEEDLLNYLDSMKFSHNGIDLSRVLEYMERHNIEFEVEDGFDCASDNKNISSFSQTLISFKDDFSLKRAEKIVDNNKEIKELVKHKLNISINSLNKLMTIRIFY